MCAAALAAAAAACAGGADGRGGRTNDEVGDVIEPNKVVRIVEIDRSALQTEGRVRYRVEDVSGQEQPDLVWSVTFAFPPETRGDIYMPEVSENTAEMPLKLVSGGKSEVLEGVCPNFERYKSSNIAVQATWLNMQVEEPVATKSRSASGERGTMFLSGKIECVGMSPDLYGQSVLWLEFENVTNTKLPPFEVQALFVDSKERTRKKSAPGLEPGARARVELDLSGVDTGERYFAVKVNFRRL